MKWKELAPAGACSNTWQHNTEQCINCSIHGDWIQWDFLGVAATSDGQTVQPSSSPCEVSDLPNDIFLT